MKGIGELYQKDDWKTEKHVPVIEAPSTVDPETPFEVAVTIGKAVKHPNTTAHHIRRRSIHLSGWRVHLFRSR